MARAVAKAERVAAEGSKRQASNASFHSGVKATAARVANSQAAQTTAKAAGAVAGVAAAKHVAPKVTCKSSKVCK